MYSDSEIQKLVDTIDKYDCRKYVYFMTVNKELHKKLQFFAPDIPRCMGENKDTETNIVDRAIKCGCKKVQFYKPYYSKELIDKAHAHGIICNMFWSDDPKEAKEFFDIGIDTVLTNDFQIISDSMK